MALTRVKKVPTANLVQGSSFLTSMPTGSVLQVLQNEDTSAVTFTSTSYTNTGFNPKYYSKRNIK